MATFRPMKSGRRMMRRPPPGGRVIEFPNMKLSRIPSWLRGIGWRGKAAGVACAAFFIIVLLPSIAATLVHRNHANFDAAWTDSADAAVNVKLYDVNSGTVQTVPLNDYLVGVLAAELDPNAPLNTLEAAAVAARTYVARASVQQADRPTFANQHGADVSTSAKMDLPWWSPDAQQKQYGDKLGVNTLRLQHAVLMTDGIILTYQQNPILAFTFQQSTGKTRDGTKMFESTIPYLVSVACPDDVKAPDKPPVTISADTLKQALQITDSAVSLADFKIANRDAQGYVKAVSYKDRSWIGEDFAALLNLPSPNFTWTIDKATNSLKIQCKGVGNGIGMSINEAKSLAAQGKTWKQIVEYFYPGCTVSYNG